MRFKETIGKESGYNCASCERDEKCYLKSNVHDLRKNSIVDENGRVKPIIGVKKEDVVELLESHGEFIAQSIQFGVCPVPFMDSDLSELINVVQACAGISRIPTPDVYYELPELYIRACSVIGDEMNKIQKEKK